MIPTETIDQYLDVLFGHSEPGAVISHLLLACTERSALGIVSDDPAELKVTVCALAPVGTKEPPAQFLARAVRASVAEVIGRGGRIHFAGLALELTVVRGDFSDEAEHARARRMQHEHMLHRHADAVEVTQLYAAARDGRRWVGEHTLTGPDAGEVWGPHERTGEPEDTERSPMHRLIRMAVDL